MCPFKLDGRWLEDASCQHHLRPAPLPAPISLWGGTSRGRLVFLHFCFTDNSRCACLLKTLTRTCNSLLKVIVLLGTNTCRALVTCPPNTQCWSQLPTAMQVFGYLLNSLGVTIILHNLHHSVVTNASKMLKCSFSEISAGVILPVPETSDSASHLQVTNDACRTLLSQTSLQAHKWFCLRNETKQCKPPSQVILK